MGADSGLGAPVCPRCASEQASVIEDVSDEVRVLGCPSCGTTWAERREP